ncbi:dimethyl sulfoxide reductase anchor subunit family protein [Schinkia azotoformans]|uniref:dimethyl sulfoxide reductase anchor subunit family protein n=1 Tax=Schinkia azotoformans TaxID=1454 RepID=UPI002DC021F6|nr:DmsC/YnfH family molybdoenzyme membrane anchor subunit [Schinkia azotoformans]MEC1716957.1 dimethyl sulfoxide reductase anchor subunit [Schinkia azotoformans]MEC1743240.1 dimethyl sulfoxide reductase anchor subunit [Schinkia azotoformans]MEC1744825.1 dimethyl sulfoxide reductase anchor subunit [Schinkia azotoformans]MEC1756997.1 dimethyl sulfoxide reductase anchor subunit [Schinkia azotoformans]MEC1767048.1 dimethyl sulfoxide reductase anchor subunit [Schinkia azotoformans]
MHEWPLLIFTVCMQAAIGGMLMLWLFYKKISDSGKEKTYAAMRMPLFIIAGLSLIGLIASFAHLGTPTNAFNTIRNIGSSWMSREILVTGMFIAAVYITAGLAIVQKKVNPNLLLVSTLIGLVDIYCMAAIYAKTLVSGWNSINTFTSFYGTALVLGPVLAVSFIAPALKEKAQSLIKYSFYIAMAGIAIQLIGLALFGTVMPEVNMITGVNAMTELAGYQGTVALRWIIEVIGVGVLGFMAMATNKKVSLSFAYLALAAIILAEGMSRYVFYVLGS